MWLGCLLLACSMLFAAGCSGQRRGRNVSQPTEVVKIRVGGDGTLHVNDKVVTRDELNGELGRLKQVGGAVIFIDESGRGPAKEQGRAVRKSIVESGLPFKAG